MLLIVLLGPPGCGKGTQSTKIRKDFDLNYLCVGDVLRHRMQNDETLKSMMSQGKLIDSEYINNLFDQEIQKMDQSKPILLDGYPRKLDQALHIEKDNKIVVIYFDIDKKTLLDRIDSRYSCSDCGEILNQSKACTKCNSTNLIKRKDDTRDIAEKRVEEYLSSTKILIEHFNSQLFTVDAKSAPDTIYQSHIKPILQNLIDQN